MIKHKIFNIFSGFSRNDLIKFEDFINSPYHNINKKIVLLFKEIVKYYPDFLSPLLNRDRLSLLINPKKEPKKSTIRHLFSDLQKLANEFMIYEKFKNSKFEWNDILLKLYTERNDESQFRDTINNFNEQLNDYGVDGKYYYYKKMINVYEFNFNTLNHNTKSSKNIEESRKYLISYIINLVSYFVTEIINTDLNVKIFDSKFKIKVDNKFTADLFSVLDITKLVTVVEKEDKDNFILKVYLHLYKTFKEIENESNFYNYKKLVFKYSGKMSRDECSYHFSMLITYCIYKNTGTGVTSEFRHELLLIYDFFLKNKYYTDIKTPYLSDDLFRNILLLALRLNKFDWTLKFIKTFSEYLHPGKKENLVNLAYAEYYSHKWSYKKSHEDLKNSFIYLNKIKEDSFVLKYDVKSIFLKIYFEQNLNDPLINQIDNYRKFLKRNKLVTEDRKKRICNFLHILKRLVFLKNGERKITVKTIQNDLLKIKSIEHRDWLFKKFNELKNKN